MNQVNAETLSASDALELLHQELSYCFDNERREEIIHKGILIARQIDTLERIFSNS